MLASSLGVLIGLVDKRKKKQKTEETFGCYNNNNTKE